MRRESDVSQDAIWKQRFHAKTIGWSQLATQNPERGLVCTNKDGSYQLYAWDVPSGTLRQLTHHSSGVVSGAISADGEVVYYLDDKTGQNRGHFVRVAFTGGMPHDLTPDMPDYLSWYITESYNGEMIGLTAIAQAWGFRVYVLNQQGDIAFTYENEFQSIGPNLSYDGSLAVIATTERSGTTDTMLEAYDITSGKHLGDLYGGEGVSIEPIGFIPKADEQWYLAKTNAKGVERPLLWHPRTGEQRDLNLGMLFGGVDPWDWTTDGRYLLLREVYQAQHQLYLYDLDTDALIPLEHPSGTYTEGYFVDDSLIYTTMQNAHHPNQTIALDMTGQKVQTLLAFDDTSDATAWQSVSFKSTDGATVQGWLMMPDGDAPLPTIVHAHGGPTEVLTNSYRPDLQAWVDQGFAVLSVNYRGSTTFGKAFKEAIIGNIGSLEVDDIASGVQWLLDHQLANPDQIFMTGSAYGGYLTLMALSQYPNLWAGGMAVASIADWAMSYEDQPQSLQVYQHMLFGGELENLAEQMQLSSPMTYVEEITAPLLIIQGENDPLYPSQQMKAYIEKLKLHDKPHQVIWFNAGVGIRDVEQAIQHQAHKLAFVRRVLGD